MQFPDLPKALLGRRNLRVLVSGGREYDDLETVFRALYHFDLLVPIMEIIHGAAEGADTLADSWARNEGRMIRSFKITKADWDRHGKAAGPIRNREMLQEADPEAVIAFPGGNGTTDMVTIAHKALVPVWDLRGIAPYEPRP